MTGCGLRNTSKVRNTEVYMKRKFIVTQNVKRFVDLMETLKNAPANLPKMALVYGDFGL